MNNKNEVWWSDQSAADYLNISLNQLHHLRMEKKIPYALKNKSPICYRKVRRYAKEALDNYLSKQKMRTYAQNAVEEKEKEVESLKAQAKAAVMEGEIEYHKGLKAYTLKEKELREACKKGKAQLKAEWAERKKELKKPMKRAALELSRLRRDLKNLKK